MRVRAQFWQATAGVLMGCLLLSAYIIINSGTAPLPGPHEPNDDLSFKDKEYERESKVEEIPWSTFEPGNLKQTVVVPTLDCPIPEGKSAIWCLSFQVAWNQFKDKVMKGPIELEGAAELCERLNSAKPSEKDISPEMCYAAAGFLKDGIIEKIKKDLAAKFPDVTMPNIDRDAESVAYAYLSADLSFKTEFLKTTRRFRPANGGETWVHGFGIPAGADDELGDLRKQIKILYCDDRESPTHFAIDLDGGSTPNQIVLARLPRKDSLQEHLTFLDANLTPAPFRRFDRLFVPNMKWKLNHEFRELMGKHFVKPHEDSRALDAKQQIQLLLDYKGASMKSDALFSKDKDGPRREIPPRKFEFNHPFLLFMKKRDAKYPFFAMWVDNAEMLANVKRLDRD